jgi:acetolactate synthase I/III small subunit
MVAIAATDCHRSKNIVKHIITVLVENKHGVLARVVGLISGRGFNIDSLNVAPSQDPTVSRMTIQVPGDDRVLEQVTKQLNKLVEVIKVSDLTSERFVDREMIVVKVAAPSAKRAEINDLASLINAKIVLVQNESVVLEMTGDQERVTEFLDLLKPFGILDVSRSGVIAIAKGDAK